ncbi:tyrosine-type recombinase/integrase [Micromonospora sp. NPDC005161]
MADSCRTWIARTSRRGPVAGRLDDLTFHDLRHTGQTLAAQTGATLADLVKRLGHSSMAAARRYLHAVDGRDRESAKALSELAAHGDVAPLPRHIHHAQLATEQRKRSRCRQHQQQ